MVTKDYRPSMTPRVAKNAAVNSNWETAIADAEAEVRRARARILKLKGAIRIFRKRIAAGDPWPGEEVKDASTQN